MEISNSKHKQKYRFFWTKEWKYGRSPEDWLVSSKALLIKALEKLRLEKLIDNAMKETLTQMLCSKDEESILLAITMMAAVKPKKFYREKKAK